MGLFGKKTAAVVEPVSLDEAKAWLGHHGGGLSLREIGNSYTFASLDLPDPGDGYYVGQLALRNGQVAANVGGQDRGYMDEQHLPYVVGTFKKSSGNPVRCVVSRVDSGWRAYAV